MLKGKSRSRTKSFEIKPSAGVSYPKISFYAIGLIFLVGLILSGAFVPPAHAQVNIPSNVATIKLTPETFGAATDIVGTVKTEQFMLSNARDVFTWQLTVEYTPAAITVGSVNVVNTVFDQCVDTITGLFKQGSPSNPCNSTLGDILLYSTTFARDNVAGKTTLAYTMLAQAPGSPQPQPVTCAPLGTTTCPVVMAQATFSVRAVGGTGRVHLPTVQEDFAAGVGLADSKIVPELYNTEDAFYSGSATVPAPDAEYTVTTDQGYPNATQGSSVSFDGTTSLSAASFAWDFGDGSAHGTGSTTTHPYSCTAAPPCSFRSTLLINQGTATATNATKIIFVTAAAAVFNYGLAVTSPSPSTVTITAGVVTSTPVNLDALLIGGATTSVTCAVTPQAGVVGLGVSLASFSITPASPAATQALMITTTAATPASGSAGYTVSVSCSSPTRVASPQFSLVVGAAFDYGVSWRPTTAAVTAGVVTSTPVNLDALLIGGATTSVTCAVTPQAGVVGLGVSLASFSIPAATQALMITTTAATPASGSAGYTVSVSCSSPTRVASPQFSLVVGAAFDYSLAVSPNSGSVALSSVAQTTMPIVTATLTGGASQSVTLSAAVTGPTGGTGVSAVFGGTVTPASPTTTGSSTMMTVTVQPTATPGTWTIKITGTPAGASASSATFTLTVTAIAGADFTIMANPSILTIPVGSRDNSIINLASVNDFSGTVNLTATVSPSGPVVSVAPSMVSLSAGGSGMATLRVFIPPSTAVGGYTVTVTGKSGFLARQVNVTVTVISPSTGDFAIDVHPDSVMINAGLSRNVTIVLKSSGFAGIVALSLTISPTLTNGPTVALSTTTMTLKPNSAGTATLMISTTAKTPNRDFTITVTATAGSLSHSDQVFVSVGSFSIHASPDSLSVAAGSAATFAITLSSDDFSDVVRLTATTAHRSSHAPTFSFSTSTIKLHSDQTVTVALKVLTSRGTQSGTYIINISGVSQSLTRSTTVALKVGNDEDS